MAHALFLACRPVSAVPHLVLGENSGLRPQTHQMQAEQHDRRGEQRGHAGGVVRRAHRVDVAGDDVHAGQTLQDAQPLARRDALARPPHAARQLWRRAVIDPGGEPAVTPDNIVVVLGTADTVTLYALGRALFARWGVPEANLFIRRQGHFSAALGQLRDWRHLDRVAEVLGR